MYTQLQLLYEGNEVLKDECSCKRLTSKASLVGAKRVYAPAVSSSLARPLSLIYAAHRVAPSASAVSRRFKRGFTEAKNKIKTKLFKNIYLMNYF